MSKKKRKIKKNKKSSFPLTKYILFTVVLVILFSVVSMFLSEDTALKNEKQKQEIIQKQLDNKIKKKQAQLKKQELQHKYFEEKTKAMEIEYAQDMPVPKIKKEKKIEESIFKYIDDEKPQTKNIEQKVSKEIIKNKVQNTKVIDKVIVNNDVVDKTKKVIDTNTILDEKIQKQQINVQKKSSLPKIAIIIDDVTTKRQVNKILNIPYPLTMSFLPPINGHKNSSKISKNIPMYMIHLPLEATTRQHEEDYTLHVGDSLEKIDLRIQDIMKFYPNTKYINNHMGSKFTSDDASMDKLLKVLKKYNFRFLDSKTASHTATKKYAKKYNLKYLSRNIFLDNEQDEEYILGQLKKAIRIAKKTGSAIAIGHPHNITLKTLKNAKPLLKGLDVVLINKLW